MSRQKIVFNHNFIKLHEQKTAELVRIKICSRTELSEDMVKQDTAYVVDHVVPAGQPNAGKILTEVNYYHLPNGSLLLLVFLGDNNIPFTTLRQFKDASKLKYKKQLNHIFDIVIKEKGAKNTDGKTE